MASANGFLLVIYSVIDKSLLAGLGFISLLMIIGISCYLYIKNERQNSLKMSLNILASKIL